MAYISWSSDFAFFSWKLFDGEGHTLDNRSVWHKDWPHKMPVGQWPIFHGPVILLNILKTVWWRNIIFGIINGSVWHKGWPHLKMWVRDLYFMVQWFYFYQGHTWYNGSVWHKDWPHKIYIGQWPIFCASNFTLYFEGYFGGWTSYLG